jgi:YhcH/YjgK/YiaL family protein
MISGSLNSQNFPLPGPAWTQAFQWLRQAAPSVAPGRVELDGDRLFVSIDEYKTRPESDCRFEAHRNYIDIQVMLCGAEFADVTPLSHCRETVPYDAQKDCAFYAAVEDGGARLHLRPGLFAVFFPEDVHRPQVAISGPAPVRKAVIKIHCDAAGPGGWST